MEARNNLVHNLLFPVLLFAALGGMSWAVRGSSGYGGSMGCVFAGLLWGTAWWFIAREPGPRQPRPYASGWIILAVTFGVGISGARGWMQWSAFFRGQLQTNYGAGEFVEISPAYGFLWLFIAGVPWAGLGACMLAWCGHHKPAPLAHWILRIACGVGGIFIARALFDALPHVFLPLYGELEARYHDFEANPNLRRLINDNRAAITHLGLYLGFLSAETMRRDSRNVILILTVGLLNGFGWALCQNWQWAIILWPGTGFNWWRCWESCGGISIGVAYGVAYYLSNRPVLTAPAPNPRPNLERFGAYLGLLLGLGLSINSGLKGWANIYLGNEDYWAALLWKITAPSLIVGLIAIVLSIRLSARPTHFDSDNFPHAAWLIALVLITQNTLAQLITGPYTHWNETIFNLYYALLFLFTAALLYHFHFTKKHSI